MVVRSSTVRNKKVELIMHFKENRLKVLTDTVCDTVLYQVLLLTVGLVYNRVAALTRTSRLQPIYYWITLVK